MRKPILSSEPGARRKPLKMSEPAKKSNPFEMSVFYVKKRVDLLC